MNDDRRLIGLIRARSLTLGERLHLSPPRNIESTSAALAPWIKAFSPGDPDSLVRRLGWDGITPEAAADALAEPAADVLDRSADDGLGNDLLAFAEASRKSAGGPPVGPADIPFSPVWSPFLEIARSRVDAVVRESGMFNGPAVDDLSRHLAGQLAWWGSPTLLERFDSVRGSGPGSFDRFCAEVLTHPLEFWADHAALLRRLLLLARQWVDSTTELVRRLTEDRDAIRNAFGLAGGPVVRVRAGLSDRHHDGRQVAILQFDDGARLVYKPRECRSLLRFNELLLWYRGRGGDEAPPPIRVLDRERYGWVEFVEHDALTSREEVDRYFRRAGALLCAAWLSGGRDLHMDNVICTANGPVIVDTEAFVPPLWTEDPAGHPGAMQLAANRVSNSVVGTGMLSFPQEDARGRVYDIGGLCGQGGYVSPAPARSWHHVNTDEMHVSEETRVVEPMQNVVRIDGRIETPEAWVDAIVSGFTAACETLLAHRGELTADDGPLRGFRDARCRVIFRPSNQYASVLQAMTAPSCSRSGLTGSLYVESLVRVFNREREKPELWPLVREERESLESLDIPLFSVGCSLTTIDAGDGHRLEGLIAESGVDALVCRARKLDREALAEQTRLIRAALLSSSGHSDEADESEQPITGALPADPRCFADEAARIGEALLAAAIRGKDGGTTWIAPEFVKITSIADLGATYYLYSGVTGPSLFLAALGRSTGDARFTEAARGAWTTLETLVASGDAKPVRNHLRLGICNGIGSIAYAAVVASDLLGDPSLLGVARGFAELIDRDRLEREADFDVEGGVAGAVLALLRLHEATAEEQWLDLAGTGVARLEQLARSDATGAWWVHEEGAPPLAGMAHGTAGVALALDAYAHATGRGDLRALAHEAFRWERTVFDPAFGNWPVRTSDGRRIDMVAWCHGAAGIGLARIASLPDSGSALDADLELAIRAVAATGLHPVDHLCCGNAGRIDFLLEASLAQSRPDLLDEARRRATTMIERASRHRAYTLTMESSEQDLVRPGLFRGLSGIGYTLLRAADPRALPCMTRFERIRRTLDDQRA
jgi:type 2 lantibiotic biosynthesis protein LanM